MERAEPPVCAEEAHSIHRTNAAALSQGECLGRWRDCGIVGLWQIVPNEGRIRNMYIYS